MAEGWEDRQTAELLDAFEALPDEEKRIFTAAFLRRAVPFDSGPLHARKPRTLPINSLQGWDAEENDASAR
jgi:hypothetical protein